MSFTVPARVQLTRMTAIPRALKLTSDGQLEACGSESADPREFAVITGEQATRPGNWQATYTAAGARDAAATLLSYAYAWRAVAVDADPNTVPTEVEVVPAVPDSRTRRSSLWDLGMAKTNLRFVLPNAALLDLPAAATCRVLTDVVAEHWAAALLALAREMDHAAAVAEHAVLAERGGWRATKDLRTWLTTIKREYTGEARCLVDRVLDVLSDIETQVEHELLSITAGRLRTGGDLREQLGAARLLDRDTVTHDEVAHLIRTLAMEHAVPVATLTAYDCAVTDELPEGTTLTEQQWRRLARTEEVRSFAEAVDTQLHQGRLIDLAHALQQAGILCRGMDRSCGTVLPDQPVAITWGFCDSCRPTDLAAAIAQGCLKFAGHFLPNSDGACRQCSIPLNVASDVSTALRPRE